MIWNSIPPPRLVNSPPLEEENSLKEIPYDAIDWLSRDKKYWKHIFKIVPRHLHHILKAERFDKRRYASIKFKMEDPVEDYGRWKGGRVQRRLDKLIQDDGFLCIDNFRWARTAKRIELKRYRQARDNGCCGSRDVKVSIGCTYFLLGYNYGH